MENRSVVTRGKAGVSQEESECVKDNRRDPHGHGNVLCLNCIYLNILVLTLNYSLARCYHLETFIEHLLCAMHSSEHINPKNNPIQEIQLMYILMGKETEAQKGSVT